jgi:ectoine hydroxylase-related dioxygenase (phytanoyl-CoA dioxygenase family)
MQAVSVGGSLPHRQSFNDDGFELVPDVLDREQIASIAAEVSIDHEMLRRTGIRNLEKKFKTIARAARDAQVMSIAASRLQGPVRLVRALFFDKTPQRNWSVAWHQDRTVSVDRRFRLKDWGPWTMKDGVHHVLAPRHVLDRMVTLRIHLDHADEDNGCLAVIPRSHRLGILDSNAISKAVAAGNPTSCVVAPGGALVMHPLLLHSSAKANRPGHRRVVHIEYSSYELPCGAAWA